MRNETPKRRRRRLDLEVDGAISPDPRIAAWELRLVQRPILALLDPQRTEEAAGDAG